METSLYCRQSQSNLEFELLFREKGNFWQVLNGNSSDRRLYWVQQHNFGLTQRQKIIEMHILCFHWLEHRTSFHHAIKFYFISTNIQSRKFTIRVHLGTAVCSSNSLNVIKSQIGLGGTLKDHLAQPFVGKGSLDEVIQHPVQDISQCSKAEWIADIGCHSQWVMTSYGGWMSRKETPCFLQNILPKRYLFLLFLCWNICVATEQTLHFESSR